MPEGADRDTDASRAGVAARVAGRSRRPRGALALTLGLALSLIVPGCARLPTVEPQRQLSELTPGAYRLDPDHTAVLFKVSHLGLSRFVGRFNRVDAMLDFDPEAMAGARLDARVATESIDVNPPEFAATLAGPDWLDSARHPLARFRSLAVRAVDAFNLEVRGELTLRGVTRPMTLRASFNGGAFNVFSGKYTLGFRAEGVLRRSEFGLDEHLPAVGDEVELEIHAEFQRTP